MNVLMVIDSLHMGGAERTTVNLAKEFVRQGHQVDLVTVDSGNDFGDLSPIRTFSLNFRKSFADYLRYGRKLKGLVVQLEAEQGVRYNLILAHLEKASRLAIKAQLSPCLHVVHSTLSESALAGRTGVRRWLKIRNKKKIYDSRRIVCVSQGIAEDMQQALQIRPAKIEVICNGIDLQEVRKLAGAEVAVPAPPFIIHVGRLDRVKRHDRLIELYRQSGLKQPLYLLGEGQERPRIDSLIAKYGLQQSVRLLGHQDNPYPYIEQAQALLLTSDFEGYPTVLMEALALNTPVISLDCPSGPREILTGALQRNLIPMDAPDLFCKRLNEIIDQGGGSVDTLERFSIQRVVQQYLTLTWAE